MMTERYDSIAARHYAAFRPPLHGPILEQVIHRHESFETGLDIGCGTGASAVALKKYCRRVIGLDSSRSMLAAAQPHPGVTYLHGSADALSQLAEQPFAVVTFAGSLSYAKTDGLRRELAKVCPPPGLVLAYDFEVLLDETVAALGADWPAMESDYPYRVDLSGWTELAVELDGTEQLGFGVTAEELAHLLLSDSNRYDALANRLPGDDPFESLVGWLRRHPGNIQLQANIHFTRWRISGRNVKTARTIPRR